MLMYALRTMIMETNHGMRKHIYVSRVIAIKEKVYDDNTTIRDLRDIAVEMVKEQYLKQDEDFGMTYARTFLNEMDNREPPMKLPMMTINTLQMDDTSSEGLLSPKSTIDPPTTERKEPGNDIDYTGGIEDDDIRKQFDHLAKELQESQDEIRSIGTNRSNSDNEERIRAMINETITSMVREGDLDGGLTDTIKATQQQHTNATDVMQRMMEKMKAMETLEDNIREQLQEREKVFQNLKYSNAQVKLAIDNNNKLRAQVNSITEQVRSTTEMRITEFQQQFRNIMNHQIGIAEQTIQQKVNDQIIRQIDTEHRKAIKT